jgi:hypothetical protein
LVPLVLAANNVNSQNVIDINDKKANGGDKFLNRYFHGSLIGLPAYDNGVRSEWRQLARIIHDGNVEELVHPMNTMFFVTCREAALPLTESAVNSRNSDQYCIFRGDAGPS